MAEIISVFENQEILVSSSAKGELIQREISSIVVTDPEFNKGLTITQMSYRCSVIKEKGQDNPQHCLKVVRLAFSHLLL